MASIYLRGKTWWISYLENGQRIQKSLKTKDKIFAKYKKNELENRIASGESPFNKKTVDIEDILALYNEQSKHRKAIKTINDDSARIRAFVNWSKIRKVDSIRPDILSAYLKFKLDSGSINLTTANHIIKTLKAFINFVISKGLAQDNQIKYLKKFKTNKNPPRFLSKEEIFNILTKCNNKAMANLVSIAVYTGMRYGEILRLRWEDINLEKNTITVPQSKSGRFRTIPIHSSLKPTLNEKIFPLTDMKNYNALRMLRKVVGLEWIGWHTFRHTFASHLVMNGVDLVTVSKLLGHSRIETTMIYSHLSDGHIQESIKRLDF